MNRISIYINRCKALLPFFLFALLLCSCRSDDQIIYMEEDVIDAKADDGEMAGMYVLCEGNMGSNKCTLDFLDLKGGADGQIHYLRNIYAERNPSEVKELGDVGNDVKVYGSQLWLVVNCSNKVEACRASDTKKIAKIDIPNCRYLAFHEGYAYVSSYVGPVGSNSDAPLGQVYKVDTLTHQIVGRVTVGYQPDELEVLGDYLYVANSGGYRAPNYDNTVSIVNLKTFQEERKVEVAINLQRIRSDKHGQLWVTSRGNNADQKGTLLWLQPEADGQLSVGGQLDISVGDLCIVGDSLYFINPDTKTYGIINVSTHQVVTSQLSTTPELAQVKMPYGIIVNPKTRDFYVMDAKNYVSSGELLHFLADGSFDYKVRTGDIPGHAGFVKNTVKTDSTSQSTEDLHKYIQAVDEYVPAPGQFVNTLPEATADDTPQSMAQKCTERLARGAGQLVTLGAFGGYITFHFDHPVKNVQGERDFAIWGNAYVGNSEPGIVMVSVDVNGNGLPDDEWYELSGSADTDSIGKVVYDYQVTYTKTPMQNVPWQDNKGKSGVVARNDFHQQEYFPLWLGNELTLKGTLLPPNGHDEGTNGTPYYVLQVLRYGYADNYPNSNREGCSFDISWAVDHQRQPVTLSHVDFIRVYNAQLQQCGWLGETSTEITGAEDLHYQSK